MSDKKQIRNEKNSLSPTDRLSTLTNKALNELSLLMASMRERGEFSIELVEGKGALEEIKKIIEVSQRAKIQKN